MQGLDWIRCNYGCGFVGTDQAVVLHEENCPLRKSRIRLRSKAPPASSSGRREEVPQQLSAQQQEEAAHMQGVPWRKVDENLVVKQMRAIMESGTAGESERGIANGQ